MPYNEVVAWSDASKEGGAVLRADQLSDTAVRSLAEQFTQSFQKSSESLIIVASFDNLGGLKRAGDLMQLLAAVYISVMLDETAKRAVRSERARVYELGDIQPI
eukprot:10864192-Karenia_brevis.AAC.1